MEEKKEDPREIRKKKLDEIRAKGVDPFPNDFPVGPTLADFTARFSTPEFLEVTDRELSDEVFALAGRVIAIRKFGKVAFFHLQDQDGKVQGYIERERVQPQAWEIFRLLDLGDLVGIKGRPFRTRTGELSLRVDEFRLLTKALRPLPEKWHGLKEVEARYRQRYLDLIVNPKAREIFRKRSEVLTRIRGFLTQRGFLEVETPILQLKAGGAAAEPFQTFHQALGEKLFLRIAPELYLKRLVTGGIDRVFELGRNFRNEGISTRHNPEFTMLEFYQAYATYRDLMALLEELFSGLAREVAGGNKIAYQGAEIDFTPPFKKYTFAQAIRELGQAEEADLASSAAIRDFLKTRGVETDPKLSKPELELEILEKLVEDKLIQPTFIYDYPVEVSPLARRKPENPALVERFEFFLGGFEVSNAFSELNDPEDQRERFVAQARVLGGEVDEDYLQALEHGMPPTAGCGIGIDRLLMILTDSSSIREVILFPLLKPLEAKTPSEGAE